MGACPARAGACRAGARQADLLAGCAATRRVFEQASTSRLGLRWTHGENRPAADGTASAMAAASADEALRDLAALAPRPGTAAPGSVGAEEVMIGAPRHGTVPEATFLHDLVRELRAHAADGAWDGRSDRELLAPLLVHQGQESGGGSDEPDPDVFWRIELFYQAVGRVIEARTGVACTLMMRMHHEGLGRVVLLAGSLVVLDRFLRDVRRFGYESLEQLDEAGERLVARAIGMIHRFPEAARHAQP
jgi:probable nitrogen fixation protein